jgi:hypothetical protein
VRAVIYLARRRLVREWRSLLPVCLVVGLSGALALGALVGGLRTASALDRMEAASEPYDAWASPMSPALDPGTLDRIRALPSVKSVSGVFIYTLGPPGGFSNVHEARWNDLGVVVMDGGALVQFARPVISEGRLPAPDSRNEVLVQQSYADAHDVHVGDVIPVRSFSDLEVSLMWANGDSDLRALTSDPTFGTPHLLVVSGIGSMQDSLVTYIASAPYAFIGGPGIVKTLGTNRNELPFGALLRLKDPSQMPAVTDALAKMLPDQIWTYLTWSASKALADRAMRPAAVVLWIFSAVVGLIGLVLVGQVLARRFPVDVKRSRTLATLGLTHAQRTAVVFLLVLPPVALGGALAIAGAYATSWLTPIGPARMAEVMPGPQFDRAYLVGAAAWCGAILVMSLVPAWRSTRLIPDDEPVEGSRLADRLTRWGTPYPITVGIRFALEPGRGTTAMPTRSTLAGAIVGGVVIAATVTFVASLGAAIAHPDRYGLNFDGAILYTNHGGGTWQPIDDIERPLREDPGVAETGRLRIAEVSVGAKPLMTLAFSGPDDLGPTIVRGRMPAAVDEVALGQVTLQDLGVSIGDRVAVASPGFTGDARIVGVVVLPSQGFYNTTDATSPGVGAVVDDRALGVFDPDEVWLATFRTSPGVSMSEVNQRVEEAATYPFEALGMLAVWPIEVQTLTQLRNLPLVLAASLLLLMAAVGAHGFFVAIRRRRRDLSVLRILGARRAALRGIGLSQGTTIVILAAIVGIPVGVIIGRWAWLTLAGHYGLLAVPEVPAAVIAALVGLEAILAALTGLAAVDSGLRRWAFSGLSND